MKKIIIYSALILLTLLIILNPTHAIGYALDGLGICYEVIIPSLFPFFVCSGLLIYSGFSDSLSKVMHPVMKPLFNIGGAGASAFVLGILSGYPLGAVTACRLYEASYLSKSETERLLAFCNNSGPLFILSAVGISMYHSIQLGAILYASHIISAIIVGILMRGYNKEKHSAPRLTVSTKSMSAGEVFRTAISNSVNSILTVSGVIIFVSVVSKLLLELIPATGIFHTLLLGGLEFVSGISELSGINVPEIAQLMLASWIVGFAGLSVHLQVMAVIAGHGLSLVPYIIGKVMHGLISALLTGILYTIFSPTPATPVFARFSYGFFSSSVFAALAVLSVLAVLLILLIALLYKRAVKLKKACKNASGMYFSLKAHTVQQKFIHRGG